MSGSRMYDVFLWVILFSWILNYITLHFRPCPCSRCNGKKTLHTRTIRRHMKNAEIVTARNELPQILTNLTWDNAHDSAIPVLAVTDATDTIDATDDMHTLLPISHQPLILEFNMPTFQHTSSDDALAVTENAPSSIPHCWQESGQKCDNLEQKSQFCHANILLSQKRHAFGSWHTKSVTFSWLF